MEGRAQILSRIKDFCKSHGVDLEQELLSYDRKKNGVISTVSLHRWIGSIGINLSNRNIQSLIIEYQKDDGIDVHKLINDIEGTKGFNQTLSERPTTCPNELADLQRDLSRRRQTIREVLEPYDRFNSGNVQANNFIRAFGASPTTHTIVSCYAIGDDVNYLRIQNDLREIARDSVTTKLEVPAPTPAFTTLAIYIKTREIDTRLTFSNSDRLNTGRLPKKQFYSILSSFGAPLSPYDLKEIAQSFQDGNFCNYHLFNEAISQFKPPPPKAASIRKDIPQELQEATDPSRVLSIVKETVADRRINVSSHFDCLKIENAGEEIALGRFIRILQGMRVGLSREDIEEIASLFQGSTGIKYKEFINAIQPQSQPNVATSDGIIQRLKQHLQKTGRQLAQSAARFDREGSGFISVQQLTSAIQFTDLVPEASHQEISALRDAFPGKIRGTVDWRALSALCDPEIQKPQEEDSSHTQQQEKSYNPPPKAIEEILIKLTKAVQSSDGRLFDEFRIVDKLRRGNVSQSQFMNQIYQYPSANLSQIDLRTLISYYRVSGSADVNYVALCRDSDFIQNKLVEESIARQSIIDRPPVAEPELPQTVHAFIKRYKAYIEMQRIQPTEPFEPYDVGHNGLVPIFKVQACFNNVNFQVMRTEVEQVVSCFRDSRKPELFNYNSFATAVSKEDITSTESRSTLACAPISAQVEREALLTCNQIREKLLARHRRVDMAFAGVTQEYIPNKEFQTRLLSIDIVLRAGQIQSLLRKYRVNLTDEIDWKKFCSDVNNSKTIGE